ncbi:unnamed protein product [Rotaria sp. Silwood2]|nr:unnamed protein product [Rotaria sp. Silwood2]CAF4680675.1 unnamed protein product [Rotaria sp. Silwood2]
MTTTIGNQTWFAENLAYKAKKGCWVYGWDAGNKASNLKKYGYLYEWNTAKTVCPDGWHLPTNDEWEELFKSLGGKENAGIELKCTNGWNDKDNGTNSSGFTALPGGYRVDNGEFDAMGTAAYWWTATESDKWTAWIWTLFENDSYVSPLTYGKTAGGALSVRSNGLHPTMVSITDIVCSTKPTPTTTNCSGIMETTIEFSAQNIPDEANRYYQRGLTALEMAKSTSDYEAAIKEFQQAAAIAPEWADVYYKIGTVQEKLERYDDAIISLKLYLKNAPNGPDAVVVKNLIYKIEYKRDLVTEKDAKITALLSGFSKMNNGNLNLASIISFIKTSDGIKAKITSNFTKDYDQEVTVLFDGSILKFKFSSYRCPRAYDLKQFPCEEIISVNGNVVSTSPLTIKVKLGRFVKFNLIEEQLDGEWIFKQ